MGLHHQANPYAARMPNPASLGRAMALPASGVASTFPIEQQQNVTGYRQNANPSWTPGMLDYGAMPSYAPNVASQGGMPPQLASPYAQQLTLLLGETMYHQLDQ